MVSGKGGLCAHAVAQRYSLSFLAAVVLLIGSLVPNVVRAGASLTGFNVSQTPPAPADEPIPPASPASTSVSPATAAAMALPAHDATVGTMAGEAGTSGGAATYSFPIVVPPGRAGMQPSLSISYNSRSGNGVMGMGWTIGGLSSVHRCPQTPEQDGQTLGVSYSGTDRLCLDGQRLVAVSGSYGATNTVYHTEVDSYARITQIGGGLTGTATCFKVEQKDGRIFHYGAVVSGTACSASTAHSRVQPGGATATSSWLVEKIEDRVGNYQSYAYHDFGNGENLLQTITYALPDVAPTLPRTVTFAYQSRTATPSGCSGGTCAADVSSTYQAGGLTMQTQALQSITTKVGTSTVRTYTPSYYASQYNGRLFMIDMQECATNTSGTACHPATHFAYNDDALNTSGNFPVVSLQGFGFSPSTTYSNVPFQFSVLGDLDGDGTKEVGVTVQQSDGQHFYLAQMTGDRQIHTGVDISTTGFGSLDGLSSDIDGSGRAAMVKLPTTGISTAQFGIWNLNRGVVAAANPFLTIASNVSFDGSLPRYGQSQNFLAADMDGDGKTDLLVVEADSSCGSDSLGTQLALFFYRNTTSGQLSSTNATASFTKQTSHLVCLNRVGAGTAGNPWYAPAIDHLADFDGDGLPDIYLVNSGGNNPTVTGSFAGILKTSVSGGVVSVTLKSASTVLTCDSSSRTSATDECNWQNGYFAHWMDINGDGLEDFVIARPYQNSWQVRLNKGGTLAAAVTATAPSYAGLASYQTNSADGSGYAFAYLNRLPTMDVDGDGKPDILVPQASLNNTAQDNHGFALKMCVAQVATIDTTESCPAGSPTNAPITGGVTSSIHHCVIYFCPPDPGTGALNLPDNIYHQNVPPEGPPKEWNNLPAYPEFTAGPTGGAPNTSDLSVYHLAALKFTQDATGAFAVSVVNTPLVSRLNDSYGRAEDLFGDGLADLTTAVGCSNTTVTGDQGTYAHCAVVDTYNGTNYGPTTFADGTANSTFANTWALYGNINQGVIAAGGTPATMVQAGATKLKVKMTSGTTLNLSTPTLPGLLNDAVNGLGDIAAWGYAPLSVPGTQDGIPYYSVPATGGYADSHNYYFQSSMPAVVGMTLSNGAGGLFGFRSAVYGYGQAIYNAMGRGFQGFQTIVSEMAVDSNDAAMWPRRTRTTTTYNQKFPLAGKIASVTQMSPSSGKTFQSETDTYVCTLATRGACPDYVTATPVAGTVYTPVLDTQTVTTSDLLTGTQSGQVTTVNASGTSSGWDAYGNLTQQVVTRLDKGTPLFLDSVAGHQTTTTNTFDTTDTSNWWVNKLTNSSVTSSITYASGYALPGTATAPSQTLTTTFTWNTDRTPATKNVQAGTANQQSTSAYCYPQATATTLCPSTTSTTSYGLPTLTKVCLGSYNASGVCVGDVASALSPERTTKYSYTKDGTTAANDGYFVLSTTNALNQITQTTHETNDGQVLTSTDPNSVKVVTTYDPFGRATEVDHIGNTGTAIESAIQSAYTSCLDANSPPNPGNCPAGNDGEDGNESNAAYRVTAVQAGYPTQVTWFDLLGRKIKTAHTGFNGTYIASLTDFDVLGTKSDQSTPYYLGDSPFFTGWSYDALGRPTKKVADVSELGGGDLQTDYTYVGRKTNLTVHDSTVALAAGACPASVGSKCLQMSRSTNVLGQMMQTTESPILGTGTTTTAHTTSFWTDPLGNVVAMKDADGNITQASYNALGQRTQNKDPDQGTWNFTYDALSELLSQTDARGVVTTVNSRDALGRTTEQQQVPPSAVPTGLQNETVLDDWTFDPANGIGELNTITRKRGSNRTTPSANPQVWKEAYGYESTTARPSTITTTINETTTVVLNSSMNYDTYGRPNTHTYPSGFVVKNGYTAYGQLNSLSNNATSAVYWTATAQNEWDHVTGETFSGSITGTHADYHSTGQASSLNWTGGAANDKFVYGYDAFSNLTSQARTGTTANTERYTYDPLQRLIQASRTGGTVNYAYSKSGNLAKKDDFSVGTANAYSYAATNLTMNGCGPHAANSVALPNGLVANYNCDANGNVIGGNTLTVTFDADNHPRTTARVFVAGSSDTIFCNGFDSITTCGQPGTATGNATWAYASTGQRYYESANGTIRYFGPGGYEQANNVGKVELGPIVVTGNASSITVVLRDRLGSTLDAIDGSTVTQRAFDAFGAARNGDMSSRNSGTLNLTPDTIRGFTGHTHEDDVALVHMNGRVFDPILGRFLSVDPIINHWLSSQGLNPYTYVLNNPLSGTDPTGYADCNTGTHFSDGGDCGALGVKFQQVSSPSVTDRNNAIASYLSAQADRIAVSDSNGAVNMSSGGAGGMKNAQANSPDRLALSNAPNTQPGQPLGTMTAIQPSSLERTYDRLSQGNWFERTSAGFAALIGGMFAPFTSEDEFGNTHNPVTGQPLFAADAHEQRIGAGLSVLAPISVTASVPKIATQAAFAEGSFSIFDWSRYPTLRGVPQPPGPFRLVGKEELQVNRSLATKMHQEMKAADPTLRGMDIHDVTPLKFGGGPLDPANKFPLLRQDHIPYTNWWNQLQRDLENPR